MPFLRLLAIVSIIFYSQGLRAAEISNTPTFPVDKITLTQTEKEWLKHHKTIRFTSNPHWLPYGVFTVEDQYEGIVPTLLLHLSEQIGITFKAVPSKNWTDVLRKAQKGTIDVIATDSADITIPTTHIFTHPILERQLAIVMHHDQENFIDNIYVLKHKKIALIKGTGYTWDVLNKYPDIDFVEVTTLEEGLNTLAKKKIDAIIISNTRANFQLKQTPFHTLRIVGQLPVSMKIGLAVRQDWPELRSILNKSLLNLPAHQQQAFVDEWLLKNQPSVNDYRWIWNIVAALALLMLTAGVISWSWYLKCQKNQLKNRKKQLNVRKERLKELNQRFELASKAAAIGVWELVIEEKDQLKLHFNHEMRHIHGLPEKKDIPVEEWLASIHPDDHQLIEESIQALYEDNKYNSDNNEQAQARSIEYRTLHPNDEIRYTHASSILVNGVEEDPDKLYGISWDITIRKRAEVKIQKLSHEAQQASRAKGRFLANMSHEIRTPMNAVMGLAHLALQVHPKPRAQVREYLHKIQDSSSSLLGIINDILDFSKIEAGKLHIDSTAFDCMAVFDRLSSLTTVEAHNKKLQRKIIIDPNIPQWLIGDPLRLGQVLLNLTQNALKFTPKGQVIVTASLKQKNDDEGKNNDISIHFSVKDTGIGIKQKQLKILFQPFEQAEVSTSRRYGGTGLGLSISQHLIEQMGGDIGVKSKIGEGTEFFFNLPFKLASVEQQQIQQEAHDSIIENLSGNVLVVEDNTINQEIARGLLTYIGLTVSIANNGREGVAAVETDHFDLILMDIQMPEMDGITACRLIRGQYSAEVLPIIAMTADAMEGDEEKSLAAGMNAHLSKPIDPNLLYHTLAKFLDPKPIKKNQTPLIDLDRGLKRVAGNGKLLEKIWRRFKAEHAEDISKLRAAIDSGNHDDARRLIHTLKGVTGNIGAEKLYQFIDKLGRNHPNEEALQKMETLLIKTLVEIETHLENSTTL